MTQRGSLPSVHRPSSLTYMSNFFIYFRLCQHLRDWPTPSSVLEAVNSSLLLTPTEEAARAEGEKRGEKKETQMLNVHLESDKAFRTLLRRLEKTPC